MKKFLKALLAVIICLVIVLGICAGGFFLLYTPSLTADLSVKTGDVTTGASGYLYGLAEEGVPSKNMTESIDISTVSQKVANGLQHPIGDIDHVYTQLNNTDYDVVYLQDNYSTWYYDYDNITEMRNNGTYDWQDFINNDYLPKVKESVEYLSTVSYSDKIVYCLYNECDNGVWFGETVQGDDGAYGDYNDVGEQNFFQAWKETYDFVKSINANAMIGGPGFYEYNSGKIERFLTYCVENDCVPDIIIYHELDSSSVYHWQSHVKSYREIEENLGISELPIIVTEYGRMQDNGLPGKMLQYITQIETTKVYADNAYWRLADNLCDVAADDNSPNANWWLYRWYTDMEGQTVDIKYQDLFKSNLGKAIKGEAEFSSQGFMGIVTINDDEDKIEVICGGRDGSAVVKLKNLDSTNFANCDKVEVCIEEVLYKGISGIVNSPVTKQIYCTDLKNNLTIDMNDMDASSAYHITITPVTDDDNAQDDYTNDMYIQRYEFESGELLGNAYTYNSAYATTGEDEGMVGGIENEGDGASITFSVPADGSYDLSVIYGNSNDGEADENGKQNPDDRVDSTAVMTIDGEDVDVSFPNTIKSEYTDYLTFTYELTEGEHTITFKHSSGTFVLDSLLVTTQVDEEVAVLADADRSNESNQSFLVVAPADGYYSVTVPSTNSTLSATVNGSAFQLESKGNELVDDIIYLMRGLNYIDISTDEIINTIDVESSELTGDVYQLNAGDAILSDGAVLETNDKLGINYINGISCNSGAAQFSVDVKNAGTYALTITYANNDEGGKHDYNVDLIERYVTITANDSLQDVYCRNTYSWDTYKTVTCYFDLQSGENTITLTNSGNTKFDGNDTYAPYISSITVNQVDTVLAG